MNSFDSDIQWGDIKAKVIHRVYETMVILPISWKKSPKCCWFDQAELARSK